MSDAGNVVAADRHEDAMAALSSGQHHRIAKRLGYLHGLAQDDPDEPSMVLASLRNLALFFLGETGLPAPQVGLSPDGLLQAEWSLEGDGVLAMTFLPGNLVRFAAVSGASCFGERRRVSGTLDKDGALAAVRECLASVLPGKDSVVQATVDSA